MKKYYLLAAAALTLAACSNDESDNWNGEIRLSSGLTVQSETRATTDIQSKQFASGESVDVYIFENEPTSGSETTYGTNKDGLLVYTTGSEGALSTSVQPHYPASGNGVNIYALYPTSTQTLSDKSTKVFGDNNLFTVASDQSGDANYKASDLMFGVPAKGNPVSRTKENVEINFTHKLAKVTVILKSGDGSPVIEGANVDLLSAQLAATVSVSESESSTSSKYDCTVTTVTGDEASSTVKDVNIIKSGKIETVDEASVVRGSCIVPAQTLPAEFVKVHLASGGDLYGTLSDNSAPSLTAGNEYTYTITVNLTGLKVTSTITPWNTVEGTGTATMKEDASN